MRSTTTPLCLGAAVSLVACSSEVNVSQPSPEQAAGVTTAARATLALEAVAVTANALFGLDSGLDLGATLDTNVNTIKDNVFAVACAGLSLGSTTDAFAVDFGAGCGFYGIMFMGEVAVALSASTAPAPKTLTAALSFTDFSVAGIDLAGASVFSTADGTTFDVAVSNLVSGPATVNADLTLVGSPAPIAADGRALVSGASGSSALALAGVAFLPTDCWPHAGSIAVDGTDLSGVLALASATATTGNATLTVGSVASCYALPAHASCKPTTCP